MLSKRADVVLRAHEIGRGLTDLERIALGVTLAQTVLTPGNHGAVRMAAARLAEHADALLYADLDFANHLSDGPHTRPEPITHEQPGSSECPGGTGRPTPSCQSPSLGWQAAWGRFRSAEQAFSDSWYGDLVGAVCLAVFIAGVTVALPLVFG